MHEGFVVGPHLTDALDSLGSEFRAEIGDNGEGLKVFSVVGVERKTVHVVHEVSSNCKIFEFFWGFFSRSTGEEISKHVGDRAPVSFIDVIEDTQ